MAVGHMRSIGKGLPAVTDYTITGRPHVRSVPNRTEHVGRESAVSCERFLKVSIFPEI